MAICRVDVEVFCRVSLARHRVAYYIVWSLANNDTEHITINTSKQYWVVARPGDARNGQTT